MSYKLLYFYIKFKFNVLSNLVFHRVCIESLIFHLGRQTVRLSNSSLTDQIELLQWDLDWVLNFKHLVLIFTPALQFYCLIRYVCFSEISIGILDSAKCAKLEGATTLCILQFYPTFQAMQDFMR